MKTHHCITFCKIFKENTYQIQAQKRSYRRSQYARLSTQQKEEYIQHIMDNRKRRKTSIMLVEHSSSEHRTKMVVIGTTLIISNEPYSNLEEPQGL